MFTRTNPSRNPSGQLNILGSKPLLSTNAGTNLSANPQNNSFQNNFVENLESENTERTAGYTRVNATGSTPNVHLTKGLNPELQRTIHHAPKSSQNFLSGDNVFKASNAGSAVNNSFTYRSRPVGNVSNQGINFATNSQTLTPIRTEGSYHMNTATTQNRTPVVAKGIPQTGNYFVRQEPSISSHQYGNRTPVN
jgi:hypothetical protein